MIQFLYHQTLIRESDLDPTLTVLGWLRRHRRQTGTKEGCASGDCGACTVAVGRIEDGKIRYDSANSCLMLVSQLHGKQLISVDNLRHGGALHPVQQALADAHGSQCGFCTPGFVMSLFTLAKSGGVSDRHAIEQALGGNLCRCTGYRPIVDAALQICAAPCVDSIDPHPAETLARLRALHDGAPAGLRSGDRQLWIPHTLDQLAALSEAHPEARLIAGGTDLMLEVTQQYRDLPQLIMLGEVAELKRCYQTDEGDLVLGAGASLSAVEAFITPHLPAFAALLTRFASRQVRNQSTLGGNLANASPIGDAAPLLLALNATLRLRQGVRERRLALADFFLDYRRTALLPGEVMVDIILPAVTLSHSLAAWKVSKRREDDISAVMGAFSARLENGRLQAVRLAWGGMAATPSRALSTERLLTGQLPDAPTLAAAAHTLSKDFQPLSDFRASRAYRQQLALSLLRRWFRQLRGETDHVEITDYVA
ncbi:xanthine dehydrogenase small subunit [Pantoea sp. 1.19]|uniref:xanthine dehydrogenase small subunit n=1 Tax=Pantoea sp. 1.19 TaxID=1925589 RepID=UPI0009491905|nr:xanthine dehydrogenase small subunit [Pantoea sp. 1.19]